MAQPTACSSTAPYTLLPRHVGLKYGPGQNAIEWDPISGRTATELQRRVQIEKLIWVEVPRAYRWIKSFSPKKVDGVLKSMRQLMNELTTELHVENTRRELGKKPPEPGKGTWEFRKTIYDYTNAQKAIEKAADWATQGANAVAVAQTSIDPCLLELLDCRKEEGAKGVLRLVRGNTGFSRPMPIEKLDGERRMCGLLTRLIPIAPAVDKNGRTRRPLTAQQLDLLKAADDAHHANADDVVMRHRLLEATARDEYEHALLRIPEFAPTIDELYTAREADRLTMEADLDHHRWADAVRRLDMADAWDFGTRHAIWHARRATKDDALVYREITIGQPISESLNYNWRDAPSGGTMTMDFRTDASREADASRTAILFDAGRRATSAKTSTKVAAQTTRQSETDRSTRRV
jgi:hypothetical protein